MGTCPIEDCVNNRAQSEDESVLASSPLPGNGVYPIAGTGAPHEGWDLPRQRQRFQIEITGSGSVQGDDTATADSASAPISSIIFRGAPYWDKPEPQPVFRRAWLHISKRTWPALC